MKTWLTSLNGVVTCSAIALLALMWSNLLDWRHLYGSQGAMNLSEGTAGFVALGYTAYMGAWLWGLLAVARAKRGGLVAALVFALLLVAYAVLDLIVACPTSCLKWPVYYIVNWLNLISGSAAAATIGLYLRAHPKMAS